MSYVCPSPNVCLTHKDTLQLEDDSIKTSLHDILPYAKFNGIPSTNEVLMNHTCPSPKIDPINEEFLVQEEDISSDVCNALFPKDEALEDK